MSGYTVSDSVAVTNVGTSPNNLDVNVLTIGDANSPGEFIQTGNLVFSSLTDPDAAGSVTFGGTANTRGVYDGSISGKAAAPNTGTAVQVGGDYFAAEPGAPVTFTFNTEQNYFAMVWGSVDTYNVLTFYDAHGNVILTINGSDLAKDFGVSTSGNTSVFVQVDVPYYSVTASSGTAAFEFSDVSYATAASPGTGTETLIQVVQPGTDSLCLLAGTGIATPEGRKLVETLEIGDLITLSDGRNAPVRWIGRQTVATRFADPLRSMPIRICANALGEALPERDLLVSPDHALAIDGVLIHASALVNNVTILRESDMPETFIYYNIELAGHELVLAENVPVETFIDNVDRRPFDNWAEYEAHYGRAEPIAEMDMPRAKSARQVPQNIRASLAARAGLHEDATLAA
jgi:hypothetical protein